MNAASQIHHKMWEVWDSLTGPWLSTLKKEMLGRAHEGVTQFSECWRAEGPRFLGATEGAIRAALEDKISGTVQRYEGLLEGLVRRERTMIRRLEDRQTAIAATLDGLKVWKAKLDGCQRQLKASME